MTREADRLRQRSDLLEIREHLISTLQLTAGPDLTVEQAQRLLQEARAWEQPGNARDLAKHLTEHPDAFTAPSPHCPLALEKLLKLLTAAGFGDKVVLLGCARCGRTDKLLKRRAPEGRCCERCSERLERRLCARCGEIGRPVARRPEGPICRLCYRVDPARQLSCAQCGKVGQPVSRTTEGAPLCNRCTPKPKKPCVRCGKLRRVSANTPKGPICKNCYTSPPRLCGICGRMRPIQRRGDDRGRPDVCYRCASIGDCTSCGRRGGGAHYRGGPFYCTTCYPRKERLCAICGRLKTISAVWPLGPVCQRCYRSRLDHPEPCTECRATRILVCVNDVGDFICTRCGGIDLSFACRSCGEEGPGFRDGECYRCLLMAEVSKLIGNDDRALNPHVQPLFGALAAVDPGSILTWTRSTASTKVLADLVAGGSDITHEQLDKAPQNARTHHIREVFVTAGILPRRNEALAQLQLWVDRTIPTLPPRYQSLIRSYAEWHIIRRARRRAARVAFSHYADRSNRQRIRTVINFLLWLDNTGTSVSGLTQHHVDAYFDTAPTNPAALCTFFSWMQERRLVTSIETNRPKDSLPQRFQDQDDHAEQLRRCLTDDSLPLEARVAGALVRLYALPTVRIVALTTDRFRRDDTFAYLVIDENAVVLPPSLAKLIEELVQKTTTATMIRSAKAGNPAYLFPGRPPSRPRNTQSFGALMKRHGLPVLSARNTAMIANIMDLDAVVVGDLFGVAPQTAHKWAQFAKTSWAAYLAAQSDISAPLPASEENS